MSTGSTNPSSSERNNNDIYYQQPFPLVHQQQSQEEQQQHWLLESKKDSTDIDSVERVVVKEKNETNDHMNWVTQDDERSFHFHQQQKQVHFFEPKEKNLENIYDDTDSNDAITSIRKNTTRNIKKSVHFSDDDNVTDPMSSSSSSLSTSLFTIPFDKTKYTIDNNEDDKFYCKLDDNKNINGINNDDDQPACANAPFQPLYDKEIEEIAEDYEEENEHLVNHQQTSTKHSLYRYNTSNNSNINYYKRIALLILLVFFLVMGIIFTSIGISKKFQTSTSLAAAESSTPATTTTTATTAGGSTTIASDSNSNSNSETSSSNNSTSTSDGKEQNDQQETSSTTTTSTSLGNDQQYFQLLINSGSKRSFTEQVVVEEKDNGEEPSQQQQQNELNWIADTYYTGGLNIKGLCSSDMYVPNVNDMDCDCRLFTETDGGQYVIPVPATTLSSSLSTTLSYQYTVKLRFVEFLYTSNDMRVFDVMIQDKVIAQDLDIYKQTQELMIPYTIEATNVIPSKSNNNNSNTADSNDNSITIQFLPKVRHPIITAIEVIGFAVETTTTTANTSNYDSVTLTDGDDNDGSSTITERIRDNDSTSSVQEKEVESTVPTFTPTTITTTATTTAAAATTTPTIVTYIPGQLSQEKNGLTLSEGLAARIIGRAGERVEYTDSTHSERRFHRQPDAGATFVDTNPNNPGGWIYVSNSEIHLEDSNNIPSAGVYSITFNLIGDVVSYNTLLKNSISNCGGGKTPWNTWISCEEYENGNIWQIDPTGIREPERITMGNINPGYFESFAYDDRNRNAPSFFCTKDDSNGEITKFTPETVDWDNDPWSMLTGDGRMEYLLLYPDFTNNDDDSTNSSSTGTYEWTTSLQEGKQNAELYYPNSEGIDRHSNYLYFVSKEYHLLFILNLDDNTYTSSSTTSGLFAGQPDQITFLSDNNNNMNDVHNDDDDNDLLYFTEDGGNQAGIHARNVRTGQYVTVLESTIYEDETTGLSFSPNNLHMYIAYQDNGLLFDIYREDGYLFSANTLDVKFHSPRR